VNPSQATPGDNHGGNDRECDQAASMDKQQGKGKPDRYVKDRENNQDKQKKSTDVAHCALPKIDRIILHVKSLQNKGISRFSSLLRRFCAETGLYYQASRQTGRKVNLLFMSGRFQNGFQGADGAC